MQRYWRFRRVLPALLAVSLLTILLVAAASASAAARVHLMVRVSEAGVDGPRLLAVRQVDQDETLRRLRRAIAESRRPVEGRVWLEVETASSPNGSGWMREDLLGRYADRC
jgi:hypothetical protein